MLASGRMCQHFSLVLGQRLGRVVWPCPMVWATALHVLITVWKSLWPLICGEINQFQEGGGGGRVIVSALMISQIITLSSPSLLLHSFILFIHLSFLVSSFYRSLSLTVPLLYLFLAFSLLLSFGCNLEKPSFRSSFFRVLWEEVSPGQLGPSLESFLFYAVPAGFSDLVGVHASRWRGRGNVCLT